MGRELFSHRDEALAYLEAVESRPERLLLGAMLNAAVSSLIRDPVYIAGFLEEPEQHTRFDLLLLLRALHPFCKRPQVIKECLEGSAESLDEIYGKLGLW